MTIGPDDSIDNDCDGDIDDPTDLDEANDIAGIVQAGPHLIQIRLDENRDGNFCGVNDLITYALASDTAMERSTPTEWPIPVQWICGEVIKSAETWNRWRDRSRQ